MGGTKDGGRTITESRGWGARREVSVFLYFSLFLKHTDRYGNSEEITENVKCAAQDAGRPRG